MSETPTLNTGLSGQEKPLRKGSPKGRTTKELVEIWKSDQMQQIRWLNYNLDLFLPCILLIAIKFNQNKTLDSGTPHLILPFLID